MKHTTFFQTLVNKTINLPLHISSSVVNSRVCKVMIVRHHPSDSMRTSAKALRRLFYPWTQQVALSRFLELLIKTASDCKAGSTAAQQGAGWWKRTGVIAITSPRGVSDTHEPMRGRCSATPAQWAHLWSCNPGSPQRFFIVTSLHPHFDLIGVHSLSPDSLCCLFTCTFICINNTALTVYFPSGEVDDLIFSWNDRSASHVVPRYFRRSLT